MLLTRKLLFWLAGSERYYYQPRTELFAADMQINVLFQDWMYVIEVRVMGSGNYCEASKLQVITSRREC